MVAIRGFGRSSYVHKPATKLYNAWLAGVPFIGGMDSPTADGEPGRDFSKRRRPKSSSAIFAVFKKISLRKQLVTAGKSSGRGFSLTLPSSAGRLLGETVPELAARWRDKQLKASSLSCAPGCQRVGRFAT